MSGLPPEIRKSVRGMGLRGDGFKDYFKRSPSLTSLLAIQELWLLKQEWAASLCSSVPGTYKRLWHTVGDE